MLLVWGVSIDGFTDGKVPTLLPQKLPEETLFFDNPFLNCCLPFLMICRARSKWSVISVWSSSSSTSKRKKRDVTLSTASTIPTSSLYCCSKNCVSILPVSLLRVTDASHAFWCWVLAEPLFVFIFGLFYKVYLT